MPQLRCPECEHEVYERSMLAIGSECPACEEGELLPIVDDDLDDAEPIVRTTVGAGPQLALARSAARKLLHEHGVQRPPVPVEEIARSIGLRIVESRRLGHLSGRLREDTIEIAPSGRARRRFVIAHELGHHVMAKPHGSGQHVEQEVNTFAGELLVPGPFLLVAVEDIEDAQLLAARFQVSQQVLEIAAKTHRCRSRIRWAH